MTQFNCGAGLARRRSESTLTRRRRGVPARCRCRSPVLKCQRRPYSLALGMLAQSRACTGAWRAPRWRDECSSAARCSWGCRRSCYRLATAATTLDQSLGASKPAFPALPRAWEACPVGKQRTSPIALAAQPSPSADIAQLYSGLRALRSMSRQAKEEPQQPSKQRRGRKKMDQAQKAQQQQAVAHAPIEANALLTAVAGCAAGPPARCPSFARCQKYFKMPRQPRGDIATAAAAALTPPPLPAAVHYPAARWRARWRALWWAPWTC